MFWLGRGRVVVVMAAIVDRISGRNGNGGDGSSNTGAVVIVVTVAIW